MRYITLCSGIECVTVAASGLGWEPICFSEIEPFPSAVLAHHYPDVPNIGDMTTHDWTRYRGKCDVLVAGTPCQAFSVAGRRESLADDRGNITLFFVEAVNAINPDFVVWENVPGVLNTKDNAFGCLLGDLVGESAAIVPDGGKWTNAGLVVGPKRSCAWRVLDAQFFGVAQRRRRVFLVASPRTSGVNPVEVLFELEGLRRDYPPGREAGQDVAGTLTNGSGSRGWSSSVDGAASGHFQVVGAVSSKWAKGTGGPSGDECQNLVAHTLRGDGFDASEDGTGRGTPLVAFSCKDSGGDAGELSPTLRSLAHDKSHSNGGGQAAIAFHGSQDPDASGDVTHPVGRTQGQETCVAVALRGRDGGNAAELGRDVANALSSAGGGSSKPFVMHHAVRRLTPRECERLQGLPDDYTRIPWRGGMAPDGPRYRAIGNGMAVPVVRWILRRIDERRK